MTNLLPIADFAARLSVSIRTLEREIADGRLTLTRIRSRRFIALPEAERYIAAQAQPCQSAKSAIDGKSASALEAASALSRRYRLAQPTPTRGRSKLRSAAPRSTLRLVGPGST